jgi:hypothetical protein
MNIALIASSIIPSGAIGPTYDYVVSNAGTAGYIGSYYQSGNAYNGSPVYTNDIKCLFYGHTEMGGDVWALDTTPGDQMMPIAYPYFNGTITGEYNIGGGDAPAAVVTSV